MTTNGSISISDPIVLVLVKFGVYILYIEIMYLFVKRTEIIGSDIPVAVTNYKPEFLKGSEFSKNEIYIYFRTHGKNCPENQIVLAIFAFGFG